MRDGIWKTLELPRGWQRVAHLCEREATRGDSARNAALRALVRDLRRQIDTRLLKHIRDGGDVLPLDYEGPIADTLEHNLLTALHHFQGSDGIDVALGRALTHVIREHLAKYVRQCDESYAADTDPAAPEVAKAFADIVAALPVEEVARALLAGEEIAVEPVLAEIDIDDDDLSRVQ
jgi:hypothetical protein